MRRGSDGLRPLRRIRSVGTTSVFFTGHRRAGAGAQARLSRTLRGARGGAYPRRGETSSPHRGLEGPPDGGGPELDETAAERGGDDLGARADVERGADPLETVLHGMRAAMDDRPDLLVRETTGEMTNDGDVAARIP